MTRFKALLAGVAVCAIVAGAYVWRSNAQHNVSLSGVGVKPPATSAWYLSSGKFAACLESGGPDEKIQEVRNSGEDPTVVDDTHGMVQVMREGPPEQWNFFRSKPLCEAYNEAGRSGAVKSETR
jgi:hypothetical protein